jgi:hypothetical protein
MRNLQWTNDAFKLIKTASDLHMWWGSTAAADQRRRSGGIGHGYDELKALLYEIAPKRRSRSSKKP